MLLKKPYGRGALMGLKCSDSDNIVQHNAKALPVRRVVLRKKHPVLVAGRGLAKRTEQDVFGQEFSGHFGKRW